MGQSEKGAGPRRCGFAPGPGSGAATGPRHCGIPRWVLALCAAVLPLALLAAPVAAQDSHPGSACLDDPSARCLAAATARALWEPVDTEDWIFAPDDRGGEPLLGNAPVAQLLLENGQSELLDTYLAEYSAMPTPTKMQRILVSGAPLAFAASGNLERAREILRDDAFDDAIFFAEVHILFHFQRLGDVSGTAWASQMKWESFKKELPESRSKRDPFADSNAEVAALAKVLRGAGPGPCPPASQTLPEVGWRSLSLAVNWDRAPADTDFVARLAICSKREDDFALTSRWIVGAPLQIRDAALRDWLMQATRDGTFDTGYAFRNNLELNRSFEIRTHVMLLTLFPPPEMPALMDRWLTDAPDLDTRARDDIAQLVAAMQAQDDAALLPLLRDPPRGLDELDRLELAGLMAVYAGKRGDDRLMAALFDGWLHQSSLKRFAFMAAYVLRGLSPLPFCEEYDGTVRLGIMRIGLRLLAANGNPEGARALAKASLCPEMLPGALFDIALAANLPDLRREAVEATLALTEDAEARALYDIASLAAQQR